MDLGAVLSGFVTFFFPTCLLDLGSSLLFIGLLTVALKKIVMITVRFVTEDVP